MEGNKELKKLKMCLLDIWLIELKHGWRHPQSFIKRRHKLGFAGTKLSQNQRFHSLHDLCVQYTLAIICLSSYSLLYTCMLGSWITKETKHPAHHVWPAHYSTNSCSCTCIITSSFSKLGKTFLLFNFNHYIQTLGPSSSDFFLGLLPNLVSWASQTVYALLDFPNLA
jgi:hypothetical protein